MGVLPYLPYLPPRQVESSAPGIAAPRIPPGTHSLSEGMTHKPTRQQLWPVAKALGQRKGAQILDVMSCVFSGTCGQWASDYLYSQHGEPRDLSQFTIFTDWDWRELRGAKVEVAPHQGPKFPKVAPLVRSGKKRAGGGPERVPALPQLSLLIPRPLRPPLPLQTRRPHIAAA